MWYLCFRWTVLRSQQLSVADSNTLDICSTTLNNVADEWGSEVNDWGQEVNNEVTTTSLVGSEGINDTPKEVNASSDDSLISGICPMNYVKISNL